MAKTGKKIASIVSAIEDGMYHASMKEKMAGLEEERQRLTSLLASNPEPPALRLHPRISDLYMQKIAALSEALNVPELRPQATEILRGLISEVRMVPDATVPGGHHIELVGDLAGILGLAEGQMTKPALGAGFKSETMVAGTGFEPVTFRL